jgi:anionic cell wall polymer biosynthesis LytR-Cps2A-Psr (LCP) family protein
MTDALGGVTVCVKQLPPSLAAQGLNNLEDSFSGWHGTVGYNRVDGAQALAFVRQRHGLPEGDIDRIRRQQQFIRAMFHEVTSTGTLTNPFEMAAVMDAAVSALTVDQGTSLADLQELAIGLQGIGTGGVQVRTVPASPQRIGGQDALVVNPTELARFLAEVTGRVPQASAGPVAEAVAAPLTGAGPPAGGGVGRVRAVPVNLAASGALPLAVDGGHEPAAADTSCTY